VLAKDPEIVKFLIEAGANVNEVFGQKGKNPLILAVENGDFDIVKNLVQNGANINTQDREGFSALHKAVLINRNDVVRYLCGNGADLSLKGGLQKRTAFLEAAEISNVEMAKYLFGKGSNINDIDRDGSTALHAATRAGNEDFVKYLVDNGAEVNLVGGQRRRTVFQEAAEVGNFEIVQYLVEKGANINAEDSEQYTALHRASIAMNSNVVKFLVKKGSDANVAGGLRRRPVLQDAALRGGFEIVKCLIENGANVTAQDSEGYTALHRAMLTYQLNVVEYLLQHGADIELRGGPRQETPLHVAARKGKYMVKLLVNNGADLNAVDRAGYTALHKSMMAGKIGIAQYLIEKGADVNIKGGPEEKTVLGLIKYDNAIDIIQFLLVHGADIKYISENLLASFVRRDHPNLSELEYLLKLGADVNLREDITGNNVLHVAVLNDFFQDDTLRGIEYHIIFSSIEFLLESGADLMAVDYEGYTPLHRAVLLGKTNIARFLMKNGATILGEGGPWRRTMLHDAVFTGNYDLVKSLVEKNADLNAVDSEGFTALQDSVKGGHLSIAKYLLKKGAKIRQQDAYIFFEAIKMKDTSLIEYIIAKEVDVNSQDEAGLTPLHFAVKKLWLSGSRFLLERGANVNALDESGSTPLHEASKTTENELHVMSPIEIRDIKFDLMKLLVEYGALVNIKDDFGNTPLILLFFNYFRILFCKSIVTFLVENGADINVQTSSHTDLTAKGSLFMGENTGETPLHIAAMDDDEELVKYLIGKGANILAVDSSGDTPLAILGRKNKYALSRLFYGMEHQKNDNSQENEEIYSKIFEDRLFTKMYLGQTFNDNLNSKISYNEKVSNFTDVNATMVKNNLTLGILASRLLNNTNSKLPIHENLLPPREQAMMKNNVNGDMIVKLIEEGTEKYENDSSDSD